MILHHLLFATAVAMPPPQAPLFGTGGAGDCVATGVCPAPAAPAGALFLATGLVAFGAAGLRQERRQERRQRRGAASGAHRAEV